MGLPDPLNTRPSMSSDTGHVITCSHHPQTQRKTVLSECCGCVRSLSSVELCDVLSSSSVLWAEERLFEPRSTGTSRTAPLKTYGRADRLTDEPIRPTREMYITMTVLVNHGPQEST